MADIHDRVMGDKPQGFLHKIAGIVPGFNGYMDRERRRDADKLLRTYLANQYSTQRDRLNRAEQSLLRAGQITGISEVDRLVGVFQRFIDRLNTATYGYSGMFDPVKVEAQDLDQLYAFDMALTSGVDEVSSAIGALESATTSETARTDIPAALAKLSSVLDELNLRLNQRGDLLTTGRGLPTDQYNSLVNSLGSSGSGGSGMPAGAPPPMAPPPPSTPTVHSCFHRRASSICIGHTQYGRSHGKYFRRRNGPLPGRAIPVAPMQGAWQRRLLCPRTHPAVIRQTQAAPIPVI